MAGEPGEGHFRASLTCNCRHDTDREVFLFQDGSLLDVNFGVAYQMTGLKSAGSDLVRISAEGPDGLSHGDTVGISAFQIFRIERSGQNFAAQISAVITE